MSASIFSPSCDLDWNAVCERVILSPQLWGPSVARGASVFCQFSSRSTAEKENGANWAFQSPIYLPPHLSTEEFYRNDAYGCAVGAFRARGCPLPCSARRDAPHGGMLHRGRAEHGNQAAQLTQPHHIKISKPSPRLQPVLPWWLKPAPFSIPQGLLLP